MNINFKRSRYDTCVYIRQETSAADVYILLYVDDISITSQDMKQILKITKALGLEFEMKDFGEASKILGMSIFKDKTKKKLIMPQKTYLEKYLQRFNMPNQNQWQPHLDNTSSFLMSRHQCLKQKGKRWKIFHIVSGIGSIMDGMVCGRPDHAYVAGVVSRHMVNHRKSHWEALKWVLRYIKGSINLVSIF